MVYTVYTNKAMLNNLNSMYTAINCLVDEQH